MRSFFPLLWTATIDPALIEAARAVASPFGRARRLAIVARHEKAMHPPRTARNGRVVPAEFAPLLVCTHRPRGKVWPADHSTSRIRRAAR